jgi:hypothetical protein
MLNNQKNSHLIFWSLSGNTFLVNDAKRLAEEILPNYFKSNFNSFVRQLNMYGFHKVLNAERRKEDQTQREEPELWEFVHPWVQRGRPEQLQHVKRKAETDRGKKRPPPEELSAVMQELHELKTHNEELHTRMHQMETQNTTLWDGLHDERKRSQHQSKKIVRCAFSGRKLASRMPTFLFLPVHTVNCVQTLKEKIMVFLQGIFNGQANELTDDSASSAGSNSGGGGALLEQARKKQKLDQAAMPISPMTLPDASAQDFPSYMKTSSTPATPNSASIAHTNALAGIFTGPLHQVESHPQVTEGVGGLLASFDTRLESTRARLEDHMDDDLLAGIFTQHDHAYAVDHSHDVTAAAAAAAASDAAVSDAAAAAEAARFTHHRRGSRLYGPSGVKSENLMFTPLSDLLDFSIPVRLGFGGRVVGSVSSCMCLLWFPWHCLRIWGALHVMCGSVCGVGSIRGVYCICIYVYLCVVCVCVGICTASLPVVVPPPPPPPSVVPAPSLAILVFLTHFLRLLCGGSGGFLSSVNLSRVPCNMHARALLM